MNFNFNMREISYVLEVANERSITKAAEKLYIAQPSLSQAIIKIEDRMGFKLFNRSRGRIELTSEGERFVRMGEEILRAGRNFESEIADIGSLEMGKLTVGMPYLLGSYLMPSIIEEYKRLHPKIQLMLREETSAKLTECVKNDEIDLALQPVIRRSEDLQYNVLLNNRMILLMSKSSPLNEYAYQTDSSALLKTIDLKALRDQPFLIGKEGQGTRSATQVIFEKAGINPPIAMISRNMDTMRHLAAAGMGCVILPELYVCDRICGCRKITCRNSTAYSANYYYLPESQDFNWQVCIVSQKNRYTSSAAKSFISVAERWCSNNRQFLTWSAVCNDGACDLCTIS